jgi:hypothetical protein
VIKGATGLDPRSPRKRFSESGETIVGVAGFDGVTFGGPFKQTVETGAVAAASCVYESEVGDSVMVEI